ncbi:MAG: potassium transporter TrkA [Planctomycetes bacterium RBG_16_55_9]|nr:MAG: potassium transporter TrkA [Planctomycetes bacterium RBG_16_55_9]
MNTLIIGGGKVVYFLAKAFLSKGYSVTIINRKRDECSRLARQLKATVVFGNATDPQMLREARVSSMDAVLAVTPNDEDNLVICQIAKSNFGVERTLALVNDPDNEQVFQQLGVTTAFSTTRMISSLIEQRAGFEDIVGLFSVAEGKVNVTEVALTEDSPVVGKSLMEINLPPDCLIACILRNDEPLIPRGATTLAVDDRLVLVTLPQNHGPVLKLLTGDTI